MPKSIEIEAEIGRGLAFLEKQQEADGSFVSHSSKSLQPFRSLRSWQTTFVPALMLASLAGLQQPAALRVRKKLAEFLLEQRDANWAFNYWAKHAPEQKTLPYPNDLDDTFCALAALYLHDPDLINEAGLAKVIKLLLATETSVGGPYRTWLVPPESEPVWLDVDVAVNSNIAFFLSLASNNLPALNTVMENAILNNTFSSPYYPLPYAFIYYFARSYGGPHKDRLLRTARRFQATAATDLDRALCLNARMRLGETRDMTGTLQEILSGQRRDGSWPAAAFYADPVKNGKLYYNGGAALTTAFVLESLQLYAQTGQRVPSGTLGLAKPSIQSATKTGVLSLARRQCRSLPADLRLTMKRTLTSLADSGNSVEIIGLPEAFNQSLRVPLHAPAEFLEHLSLANLNGWAAYTIYDDFLDDEGQPGLLSAANVAMRNSFYGFLGALPDNQAFRRLVREIFNIIDGANAWEVAHCRFKVRKDSIVLRRLPDYGDLSKLAERSLGHTLAPIAILSALEESGKVFAQTRDALKHYLIVRQINDDLHDWQEDLENGRITYVVAGILSGMGIKTGTYELPGLRAKAGKQFWYKTLPAICREMRAHIALSRQALKKAAIFSEVTKIGGLLDGLEASVDETLDRQSQAESFLKHYRRKAVRL